MEPFSYVHLRVSLPNPLEDQELFGRQPPESYFLMRRSKDGFISCTGMLVKLNLRPVYRSALENGDRRICRRHSSRMYVC